MPRTTLNLDAAVLRDLKRRQRRDPRPLGDIASELLASALREPADQEPPFRWISKPLGTRVDLEDKDAVWKLLDGERL